MPPSPDPFHRRPYDRARVALALAAAAGSSAWSPAGRGAVAPAEFSVDRRLGVEPGDRALPIVYRN